MTAHAAFFTSLPEERTRAAVPDVAFRNISAIIQVIAADMTADHVRLEEP
jgi:hypothetical protein